MEKRSARAAPAHGDSHGDSVNPQISTMIPPPYCPATHLICCPDPLPLRSAQHPCLSDVLVRHPSIIRRLESRKTVLILNLQSRAAMEFALGVVESLARQSTPSTCPAGRGSCKGAVTSALLLLQARMRPFMPFPRFWLIGEQTSCPSSPCRGPN
jgi:hypothetical protein